MAVVQSLSRINVAQFAPRGQMPPVLQAVADVANHCYGSTRAIVLSYPAEPGRTFSFTNGTGSTVYYILGRATVRVPAGYGGGFTLRLDARGQSVVGTCDIMLSQDNGVLEAFAPLPASTGLVALTDAISPESDVEVMIGVRVPAGAQVSLTHAVLTWDSFSL
jgi:hypothetical protein